MSRDDAGRLADERGWSFRETDGGYRRIVPSPAPRDIVQLDILRLLVEAGVMAICAGGGGIPIVRQPDGSLEGVEAVVDKDRVSALLARQLDADRLLLLTDVDAVCENWQQEDERKLGRVTPDTLAGMDFEAGSMRPKVEAAAAFARETGRPAAIGRLEDAARLAAGECGTQVSMEGPG